MPIPEFNAFGLLPEGIHDATWEEIEARFGRFGRSDCRPRLWAKFKEFLREARAGESLLFILLNGSFVTTAPEPNDIDLVLVVAADHDFGRDLSPAEYNVLSRRRVHRRYGFDVLVARSGSEEYARYVRFFQQVRLEPDRRKGILRLRP